MSTVAQQIDLSPGSTDEYLLEQWDVVFEKYYEDDLAQAVQRYPSEQDYIVVDYDDIYLVSVDLADDVLDNPKRALAVGEYALETWEFPGVEVSFDERIELRVRNLPDGEIYQPEDLRAEHGGQYVGVKGSLGKVTQPTDYPEVLQFRCPCGNGSTMEVPQPSRHRIQEPTDTCPACEKRRWEPSSDGGRWVDFSKIRIQQSIDQAKSNEGSSITGNVAGTLVEGYGEELYARAGEDCIVYGIVERRQRGGRDTPDLSFTQYLDVRDVTFDTDSNVVDPEAHRDRIEELAARDDAVQTFVQNVAPQLKLTDRWERAVWLAVVYLFKAPRIHTPSEEIYRGDIHAAIIGDPGIGKSVLNRAIENISPKAERRSATGISSEVGLTAAATKDDFGEGEYTLEPGILVRANGGHAIIDEIDKGPSELEKINDALEGDQRVTVDKGGKHAEFATRTALWATGNPDDGRFDQSQGAPPLPGQVDLGESLVSRFDGIVLLPDTQDEDHDEQVSGHILDAYAEASNEDIDPEILDREVTLDELQAWVMLGQEIEPALTDEAKSIIQEYYIDLRGRNDDPNTFTSNARAVEAMIRFAGAFARLHLDTEIQTYHAELATKLMDKIVGQYYDPESGEWVTQSDWMNRDFGSEKTPSTQEERVKAILDAADHATIEEIAEEAGLGEATVSEEIDSLMAAGKMYEPRNNIYQST